MIVGVGVPLDMVQKTTNLALDGFPPNNFCFAKIPKTSVFRIANFIRKDMASPS
jgi:hypothetical protein